jgi:hypothetical protein
LKGKPRSSLTENTKIKSLILLREIIAVMRIMDNTHMHSVGSSHIIF